MFAAQPGGSGDKVEEVLVGGRQDRAGIGDGGRIAGEHALGECLIAIHVVIIEHCSMQ